MQTIMFSIIWNMYLVHSEFLLFLLIDFLKKVNEVTDEENSSESF